MDKDFLIKLTSNLYRLTLFFPKKEPLRYRMRGLADDILVEPNQRDLEIMDSFFEVAKNQNWVSSFDILEIQKGYANLKEQLQQMPESFEVEPQKIEKLPFDIRSKIFLNQRQEKILEVLREKGRVQVWEVQKIFPKVSKRTLRRDFESLLKQKVVQRIGERNDTYYQLRGRA